MAFKQNLMQRLFKIGVNKFSNQAYTSSRISSSSSAIQSIIPPDPEVVAPIPSDQDSIFGQFLHRRPLYLSSPSALPEILRPGGEKLLQRLREMDIARNRDLLRKDRQLTATDAKKMIRASRMEALKLKLRSSKKNHVTYDEFIEICVDECCDRDQGVDVANVLDKSGCVIVLGNIVFLKPEQVMKAINELMTKDILPMNQLKEMEQWKSKIDEKAYKMVRRELWGGLGYLMVQTAAFMRLTFWELSWDVMEPICFYVTSAYFMIGYAYFMRTSREPSFEAVYQSRFRAKQMKLMKIEGFDFKKFNELKKICGCYDQPWRMNVGSLKQGYVDDDDTMR
ncbi:hypothetical protein R6Q59_016184 [Mikania micrantha]|uniref:Calcium uniporter protein C-terminal domain-containing protein n=1 Tax=Mikania micrantha TaxID=192012 RepID=A0A5N6PRX2_9ASTR|nr:hypothetical protein E3N88_06833 [Mikania micrantha]